MAYVVAPSGPGVAVLDLADPTQPRIAGQLQLGGDRVALAAMHLYVSQGNFFGIPGTMWHQVVDVRDPTRPTIVGRVPGIELPDTSTGGGNEPVFVAAAADRVLAARGGVIAVTTLADPTHEVERSTWTDAGTVDDAAGDRSPPSQIYTTRTEGIAGAVSLSGDGDLTMASILQVPAGIFADHVAGGHSAGGMPLALVSDGNSQGSQLAVVNMSDADLPRLAASVEIPDFTHDVAGDGTWAVLAVTNFGNEPPLETPTPRPTGTPVPFPTESLPFSSVRSGLRLVDIRNPASPRLAGSVFIRRDRVTAGSVTVAGKHGYLGTSLGITGVDISDPQAPAIVSQTDSPSNVTSLAVFGDRLLAAGSDVVLFDMRDQAKPQVEGRLGLLTSGPVALDGRYAYVTVGTSVQVFPLDLAWPTGPIAELRLAAVPKEILRDPTTELLVVAAGPAGLYTLRLRAAPIVPTPTSPPTPSATHTPETQPSATAMLTGNATASHQHRVWLPWVASPSSSSSSTQMSVPEASNCGLETNFAGVLGQDRVGADQRPLSRRMAPTVRSRMYRSSARDWCLM
jgi:hypothetical protein